MESANAAQMTLEQFMVKMMVMVCFKHRRYHQYFDVWNLHLQLGVPEEELQELVDQAVKKGWIAIIHRFPEAHQKTVDKRHLHYRLTEAYPIALLSALSETLHDSPERDSE